MPVFGHFLLTLPSRLKTRGIIMSFNIVKQLNADEQEGSATPVAETAATPNVPVAETTAEAVDTTPNETEPVVATAPVEERIATAHDDFDWSVDKRNVSRF
jgi:small subunit ribosomal protein S1